MNPQKFQELTDHYIAAFEMTNGPQHTEYYKWRIAKAFRPMMEEAMAASDAELSQKLYAVKRMTANLIDSYTQPFSGLVNFAKEEPGTVRGMFRDLFAVVEADVETKEKAIYAFLDKSLALREKYYPESYLYKDDMHSVTGYLFLFDPDHNYLYKATHCREFADCLEFYDDWGAQSNMKLDIFYRMCDECIGLINSSPDLLATAESRFEIDKEGMHPDTAKHILLFDMIYCSSRSTYNLLNGIHYVVPKNKERQLMQERKDKANKLKAQLDEANGKAAELERVFTYIAESVTEGKTIRHKAFGTGKIRSVNGNLITCDFENKKNMELGTKQSILNGLITVDGLELSEEQIGLLLDESKIRSAVSYAEKVFAPYSEYLD